MCNTPFLSDPLSGTILPRVSQVCGFYQYLWECRYAKPDEDLLHALPVNLKAQVEVSLKRQLVERVKLFESLSLPCLVDLVTRLVPLISLPDEYVIVQGEEGDEVLFLKVGSVKVTVSRAGREYEVNRMFTGATIGEAALLDQGAVRSANVVTLTFCDFQMLMRDAFEECCAKFPELHNRMRRMQSDVRVRSTASKESLERACMAWRPIRSYLESIASSDEPFSDGDRSTSERTSGLDVGSGVACVAPGRDPLATADERDEARTRWQEAFDAIVKENNAVSASKQCHDSSSGECSAPAPNYEPARKSSFSSSLEAGDCSPGLERPKKDGRPSHLLHRKSKLATCTSDLKLSSREKEADKDVTGHSGSSREGSREASFKQAHSAAAAAAAAATSNKPIISPEAYSSSSSCGVDDSSAGRSFKDLCAGISSLGSQVSSSRSSSKDGANAITGSSGCSQGPGSRLVKQKSASAPNKLVGGPTSVSGKGPSPALSRARQAQGRRPATAKHRASG